MKGEVDHILDGHATSSRLHTLCNSVIDAVCLSQVVIGLLPTTQHLTGYSNSDLSIPKNATKDAIRQGDVSASVDDNASTRYGPNSWGSDKYAEDMNIIVI